MVETRLGEQRPHPALVELRQQRLTLARLIVSLRIPLGDQEDTESASVLPSPAVRLQAVRSHAAPTCPDTR